MIIANTQRLFSQLRGRRFNLYFADNMGNLTNPSDDVDLVSTSHVLHGWVRFIEKCCYYDVVGSW